MLDNLVESKSNLQSSKRRGSYLVSTGFLVFSIFASGICWSLFARDLSIGSDSLELSALVPPMPMSEDDPPAPEPVKQIKRDNSPKTEENQYVRKDNVARTDEPIAPKEVSTSPTNVVARPATRFTIGREDSDPAGTPSNILREGSSDNPGGITDKAKETKKEETEDNVPPKMSKKEEPAKTEKRTVTQSLGVINGKAVKLPKPPYPAPAQAVRASGEVNVQVTIDEQGNVVSAKAVSGHSLLRQAAENAARQAKFEPTLLSKVPVKVTGVIVYRFAPQ